MKEFTRGQKTKLSDLGVDNNLVVGLIYNSPGILIDFSCFGLDKDNKLSDDRYLQFFNQPSSPCNSINASYTSDKATFTIDLSKLPQTIEKLVFTAAIDTVGKTMSQINNCNLQLENNNVVGSLTLQGSDFALERALMVGELYRKDDIWRFAAVGQGFNGGLDALVKHFGGEVAEESAPVIVQ